MDKDSTEPDVNRYLYERIYVELKREIQSGKFHKGDWFPPERVLKDRFETTHLTVRNALAKLVLEGYIERYSGKGTLVIYSRDRPAAPKSEIRFPYAMVILNEIDEPGSALLDQLEQGLRRMQVSVRVACHRGDPGLQDSLHGAAVADGALVLVQPAEFLPAPGGVDPPARFSAGLHTTVMLQVESLGAPCTQAVTDDEAAAREAVRYLADLGHRAIAFVQPQPSLSGPGLRAGFELEMAARGFVADDTIVIGCAAGIQAGAAAASRLRDRSPACRVFLCGSDETAAGVARFLRESGEEPGNRAAVIGYGNTRLAAAIRLTSVDPGYRRLAEAVLAAVSEAGVTGALPQEIIRVAPELRVRESCGRPSPGTGAG